MFTSALLGQGSTTTLRSECASGYWSPMQKQQQTRQHAPSENTMRDCVEALHKKVWLCTGKRQTFCVKKNMRLLKEKRLLVLCFLAHDAIARVLAGFFSCTRLRACWWLRFVDCGVPLSLVSLFFQGLDTAPRIAVQVCFRGSLSFLDCRNRTSWWKVGQGHWSLAILWACRTDYGDEP